MSGSNIKVYGSFEVPSAAGTQQHALVYGAPLEPGVTLDMLKHDTLPVHEVATRVAGHMQTSTGEVGRLNSAELAAHMTTEEGYRFAAPEGEPMKPLAFAFIRELPPREPLLHHLGSVSTDFVLEQFGVTWESYGGAAAPSHYRVAANGLLRVITDAMKQLDNIYVAGYPHDTRDPGYFTQFGFQQVSEGVHRVWERNRWGGRQSVLYGARVGYVQQAIRGELPIQEAAEHRAAKRQAVGVVQPAVSA
jgi:hypothetical protein